MTTAAEDLGSVEIVHQPTLPELELPEYHGRKPIGMRTAVSGAGSRLTRPHGIGDRLVVLVELRCRKAGHEETDDGMVYVETHKVVDMFEIQGDAGARLLSTVRSAYRTAADAVNGKSPMPELGEVGYTDGSGVVLTPAEVAELRGDPVRAMLTPSLTPALVVYDDGSRELWPDEFAKDHPRPVVGERFTIPADADPSAEARIIEVVALLHHETGETLGVDVAMGVPMSVELAADDAAWEGSPEDHRPLDDGVEDYGAAAETRDASPPPLPGEDDLEARLPTSEDFRFVDVTVPNLRVKLAYVADLILLRRFHEAEKQGRGRGLIARKGATDAILARIAEIESTKEATT